MAVITGYTAEKMDEINDSTIVDGNVVGNDLHLVRRDGGAINAGNVRGIQGIQGIQGNVGPTGPQGIQGIQGPLGPTGPAGGVNLPMVPQELATQSATYSASGATDMFLNNCPVVLGHLYGVRLNTAGVDWASFDIDAVWHIHLYVNGANYKRFASLKAATGGSQVIPLNSEVFWLPTATGSTDDLLVRVTEVVPGSEISFTAHRSLTLIDYGIPGA